MAAGGHSKTFDALRPAVLSQLLELRGTIDDAYQALDPDAAAEEFSHIISQLQAHLDLPMGERLRDFAERWVALRIAEGQSPRSLLHSVVAIGDVIVAVAKKQLPSNEETVQFVRAVVHANFVAARSVVEVLALDLERRRGSQRR